MKTYSFRIFHHTLPDRDYIEVKNAVDEDDAREKARDLMKAFGFHYSGHSLILV